VAHISPVALDTVRFRLYKAFESVNCRAEFQRKFEKGDTAPSLGKQAHKLSRILFLKPQKHLSDQVGEDRLLKYHCNRKQLRKELQSKTTEDLFSISWFPSSE
jgi:hypothetical protein